MFLLQGNLARQQCAHKRPPTAPFLEMNHELHPFDHFYRANQQPLEPEQAAWVRTLDPSKNISLETVNALRKQQQEWCASISPEDASAMQCFFTLLCRTPILSNNNTEQEWGAQVFDYIEEKFQLSPDLLTPCALPQPKHPVLKIPLTPAIPKENIVPHDYYYSPFLLLQPNSSEFDFEDQLIAERFRLEKDQAGHARIQECKIAANETILFAEKYNVQLVARHLTCLTNPNDWVNSDALNFYFVLLTERDTRLTLRSHDFCRLNGLDPEIYARRPSYFCESSVYTFFSDAGTIDSWKNVDLHLHDKVFLPINIDNTHWVLVVIFVQKKKLVFYDSLLTCTSSIASKKIIQTVLRWWIKYHQQKNLPFFPEEWTLSKRNDLPQQPNGFDCGIYTMLFADLLADDLEHFHQSPLFHNHTNIQRYRRKILLSILLGTVLH